LKTDSKFIWKIYYIGRQYNSSVDESPSIESQIIPKLGVNFYPIACGKLDRRWLPNTLKGIPQTLKGFFSAFNLVSKIKPDIVISFGGYVSVPVVISSYLKKIPSITHEQTLTNSLTTRINSILVNKVALSFNNKSQIDKLPNKKVVVTGNLIRSDIYNEKSDFFYQKIKSDKPILYITAGNQGSHKINLMISQLLPNLKRFTVIHQTGKNDYTKFIELSKNYPNYFVFDYINSEDVGWVLNHSKIIISRAGANTCQEIVALKKSSILIPLLKSQQNEQILNASWVKKLLPQKTKIILETQLNSKLLKKSIDYLNSIEYKPEKTSMIINSNILKLIHEFI
jgi:UDP-N-acetylglucosamine--N-acetylmuramyl-(pentapeptide) pyrophosphoryl-undecaprenol N-acetylglucosamine transferase